MSAHPPAAPAARLDAATRREIARRLDALAGQLVAHMAAQRERLSAEASATPHTFIAGSEGAVASAEDDDAMALLRHDRAELQRVRNAQARLADAGFGCCTECGEPIGRERLLAVPQAGLCISCQHEVERHRQVRAAQGVV